MIENLRPEQIYREHVAQAAFITAERLDVARRRQNISNKIAARRQIPLLTFLLYIGRHE